MSDSFEYDQRKNVIGMQSDSALQSAAHEVMDGVARNKYTYNFKWLGLPIIQLPTDIVAMQEVIWEIQPDVIVETGIARGGSLIFYASMLELLDNGGKVIGVDVDIRPPQREMIENHKLFKYVSLLEGDSTNENIFSEVRDLVGDRDNVLVILDSNHTHEHVLAELELYSTFVQQGGYLIVFDTVIADMPEDTLVGRSWTLERNPKTAVHEFLQKSDRFEIDKELEAKLLMTNAPDGFLRCIKDH